MATSTTATTNNNNKKIIIIVQFLLFVVFTQGFQVINSSFGRCISCRISGGGGDIFVSAASSSVLFLLSSSAASLAVSSSSKESEEQQDGVCLSSSRASSSESDNSMSSSAGRKKIFITGSTDGIGLEAAKRFAALGHHVMLHGRSKSKVNKATQSVLQAVEDEKNKKKSSSSSTSTPLPVVEGYVADLSIMANVEGLAKEIKGNHDRLDVLINNAGVFKLNPATTNRMTSDGFDLRFAVNTIAPYYLTQLLLPIIPQRGSGSGADGDGSDNDGGRIVNLSSAAQASVNIRGLIDGNDNPALNNDFQAYAQSKLAITMWSAYMAKKFAKTGGNNGPMIVSVNPGSMLGTKMVQEGFGVSGNDISIGANILLRAALNNDDDGFSYHNANGKYFDNDSHRFSSPHQDANNDRKVNEVIQTIENILSNIQQQQSTK